MKRAFQEITNLKSKNFKITIHKSSHRKKLFRWLFNVNKEFNYNVNTFILTMLIIDKFTEKYGFSLDEYQLIGISSLFISAKIEETKTKSIKSYFLITDKSCTIKEILKKEKEILENLDYSLNFNLPQKYINIDYLKNSFKKHSIEIKKEMMLKIMTGLYERNIHKNMFMLYLEGLKELEKILGNKEIEEDIKYYVNK